MSLLSSIFGLGWTLLAISLLMVLFFLRYCLLRLRRFPESGERKRKGKKVIDTTLLLLSFIFFFAGIATLNFALFLQTYHIYAVGQPIAEIQIKESDQERTFILNIKELGQPLSQTKPQSEQTFQLVGEMWSIQGHIVRFHPVLSYLGVKPVYQLTRVQSSFFVLEDEEKYGRDIHTLVQPRSENWWRWMYQNEDIIPGLKMISGSAVTKDAKPGQTYQIFVTPNGFTLEPIP